MANAKKCDRCEKFYVKDDVKFSIGKTTTNMFEFNEYIDLCPDCCEQFNKWLGDKNAIPIVIGVDEVLHVDKVWYKPLEPVPEMPTDYKITCCEENPCDISNSTIKIKKDE